MVVQVYISGISGNKEVKKRQQRVILILDSKNVQYELVDIAEPENEEKKDFMQSNSTSLGGTISDPTPRHPLPPQIFNDDDYCGDYHQFDMANEIDEMEKFLKLAPSDTASTLTSNAHIKLGNGEAHPEHTTTEEIKETKESEEPEPNNQNVPDNKEESVAVDERGDVQVENGEDIKETTEKLENESEDE